MDCRHNCRLASRRHTCSALWNDLRGDEESLSATVRNIGLVIGGVVAILLAVWRSVVGSRQADTAERGLLNERYQKGADMLGNHVLSVRLGGIYALQQLADEYPQQYHVQVMRLFCAFVRTPTMSGEENDASELAGDPPHTPPPLREDIQAVVRAIGTRREEFLDLEGRQDSIWICVEATSDEPRPWA